MIEVHHLNNSRSQRVLWLLEELGTPYTIVRYEREPLFAPESLKDIHPLGKSPVIRDGERVVAESAVIIEYLLAQYAKGKLTVDSSSPQYWQFRYWMHYAEASLMPQLLLKMYMGRIGEAAARVAERIESQVRLHLDFVEQELGDAPYLAGDQLTAADIQMSFPLEVAAAQRVLNDRHPKLGALLKRLHERPAYQRAMETGGKYDYA
jgi:glutathione S-transferase